MRPERSAAAPAAAPLASPDDAAIHALARAFLTPRRPGEGLRPLQLPDSHVYSVPTGDGRLAVREAGEGPAVLLVHGWEGQASDLAAIARTLLAQGHRVLAVDLPAHGASTGDHTSIPASARALRALQQVSGPLHAVVAHSVGAAVAVHAMAHGLEVGRAALIAAPARYRDYAAGFGLGAGLDRSQLPRLFEALRALGVDVQSVSMPHDAAALTQPALFVHSADDRVVSLDDARTSSQAWRGARLLQVEGLGHRRLLDDAAVIEAVARFVAGQPLASPREQPGLTV